MAFNNLGLPNIGSNHMLVGFTLSKNRTEALAFAWGLHYLVGDRLTGAHASWEARYRFLNLNPLVVPVVFAGLGVNLGNLEEFKKKGDRAAQLVGGFRGGLAIDIVEVTVPNPDKVLQPGMYGRASLTVAERAKGLVVPASAVLATDSGRWIFVVKDGVARRMPVELGYDTGEEIEIRKGLRADDNFVVVGRDLIGDGAPVRAFARPLVRP